MSTTGLWLSLPPWASGRQIQSFGRASLKNSQTKKQNKQPLFPARSKKQQHMSLLITHNNTYLLPEYISSPESTDDEIALHVKVADYGLAEKFSDFLPQRRGGARHLRLEKGEGLIEKVSMPRDCHILDVGVCTAAGTPLYKAPEQQKAYKQYHQSPASAPEFFAVGVVLYEILSGMIWNDRRVEGMDELYRQMKKELAAGNAGLNADMLFDNGKTGLRWLKRIKVNSSNHNQGKNGNNNLVFVAEDLIRRLLVEDPKNRIGTSKEFAAEKVKVTQNPDGEVEKVKVPGGVRDILRHPFFENAFAQGDYTAGLKKLADAVGEDDRKMLKKYRKSKLEEVLKEVERAEKVEAKERREAKCKDAKRPATEQASYMRMLQKRKRVRSHSRNATNKLSLKRRRV
jgi:serine/threonine protein kinase